MARRNKFIKFIDMPLKDLIVGMLNVRVENVNEGIEDLAEHIYVNGLLEPPIIYEIAQIPSSSDLYEGRKSFVGKFEILAGQRRFTAYKRLNEQYPGEGFDTIPCHLRSPPDDLADAISISVGENLTQLPMTMTDSINGVTALFDKENDFRVVAKKYGISIDLVKKYVKAARLPPLLKLHLGTLHKNPKTAMNIALDAADALDFDPTNENEVKRVVEFAKKLAEKKKVAVVEYNKLKQAGEENPKKSVSDIEKVAQSIKRAKEFVISLNAITSGKLEYSAVENGKSPEEEGADIITESLETRISQSAEIDSEQEMK